MRGGRRAGSGRKTGPGGTKAAVTLWLTSDVSKYLETFGVERSRKTDTAIRRTAEFRAWKQQQGESNG